jgi:gamma-glutamylcyclotransferase (GGCT)/AIG2-like uncharacterized protein YtfP
MNMTLIFCYGTLMRGQRNHDRFCRGAVSIEPAAVRGRLYELLSGIPVLRVPDWDILAHGTHDPISDIAAQEPFDEPQIIERVGDESEWVHGELMMFYDPETRLPSIDRLEGFRPGGPSLYRRVLVYVYSGAEAIAAWCYVVGDYPIRNLSPTGKVAWP